MVLMSYIRLRSIQERGLVVIVRHTRRETIGLSDTRRTSLLKDWGRVQCQGTSVWTHKYYGGVVPHCTYLVTIRLSHRLSLFLYRTTIKTRVKRRHFVHGVLSTLPTPYLDTKGGMRRQKCREGVPLVEWNVSYLKHNFLRLKSMSCRGFTFG